MAGNAADFEYRFLESPSAADAQTCSSVSREDSDILDAYSQAVTGVVSKVETGGG